jgi:hypothetical protein
MNEAHVFQHKYTGIQIFVYQFNTVELAHSSLSCLVFDKNDWIYLCKKVATEVN